MSYHGILLPECQNAFPPIRRLLGGFIVVGSGDDLKGFRVHYIYVVKPPAKDRWNDFIRTCDDDFDGDPMDNLSTMPPDQNDPIIKNRPE